MTEVAMPRRRLRWTWFSSLVERGEPPVVDNAHALAALERHKRHGMKLAVRARIIAMSVISVVLAIIVPWPAVIYYLVLVLGFIGIGLLQSRFARVGTSRVELILLFCDLALMTIVAAVPNPLIDRVYPLAFQFQFEVHKYFFLLLAMATLAYSWRTIFAVGTWTSLLWGLSIGLVWFFSEDMPELSAEAQALFSAYPPVEEFFDPTRIVWDQRLEEIVVFMLCAVILGVSVRRFNVLLLAQASAERERTNLARYFSPNVVEELSHQDEPLARVRTQQVAVLFVDIIGFTQFAAHRPPEEVIATLRDFHGRMEAEVFRHSGTLDKYLGDGLMATFGTPFEGEHDALDALTAARAMMASLDEFNAAREKAGEPRLEAGIGVHYGPVVLGDIGANRLEFAVIGNTVNVASRLEALTRQLSTRLVVSDEAREAVVRLGSADNPALTDLVRRDGQQIRGVEGAMTVWTLD